MFISKFVLSLHQFFQLGNTKNTKSFSIIIVNKISIILSNFKFKKMSNVTKNANVKSVTKNVTDKKETAKLQKINFEKFANIASKITESAVTLQKSLLYIYPTEWTKNEINNKKLGGAFRSKRRKELNNFANIIFLAYQKKNIELLKTEVEKFKVFYKEFYRVNDFSINSVTHTKDNETVIAMMQLIKENFS